MSAGVTACEPASEAGRGTKPNWGLVLLGASGAAVLALYAAATPFVAPALRRFCLPFVPATPVQVIAAAKQGFRAVGYELNPWLVWYSRYRAWQQGVHRHTRFYISDFWKVNFSEYSNVVIFGVPQMMESLEKKLQNELKNDAKVVACRFPFPSWIAEHESGKGIDAAWLYNAKSFKTTAKEGNQH
ncbi:ATP synthase subunit C lysine N-methyltransferase-like isoform X2 [Hypanus sabinus]|uniref:ATP synthase subunit C lysine N-methyltransferase-like isoform X2 n=1 Tax=Hypanus sabinus TaxID=79690 RepID=UPI0028C4EA13|nr:ATP synthase subunit C lysine N-methyltransferase-like isoform X2 [Hypanus sabinus]